MALRYQHGPRWLTRQTLSICRALGGNRNHRHHPTSQLLQHRPLDQYGPWSDIALRHQHGLRWLTRPWVSAQPLVVTESIDINTYPGWCSTVESDMALSSSPGPEDTMALVTVQATHISMVLAVSWHLNCHMATGCSLDPGHPCTLPRVSTAAEVLQGEAACLSHLLG